MAGELIRQLQILTPQLKQLQGNLDPALMQGVGRSIEITPRGSRKVTGARVEDVAEQSKELSARALLANKEASSIRLTDKQKAMPVEQQEQILTKPFSDLADQIRQATSPDGTPSVLAGYATALLALDAPTRQMVLRRAGNPEVFQSLAGAGLAEPPEGTGVAMDAIKRERTNASSLPALQRPAFVLSGPDYLKQKGSRKGEIGDGSEEWKKHKIRDNSSLHRLAGPMLAQAKAITDKGGTPRLPLQVVERKKTKYGGGELRKPRIDDDTITVGTDENYWRPGDARRGIPSADMEVARRNRTRRDSTLQAIEKATETGGTFDLDRMFSIWRARFATVDGDGNIYYPKALPTAEFITGLMRGMLSPDDPDFFNRHLETIRRSIDASPDVPDASAKRYGRQRTAHEYSQRVFLPGKKMEQILRTEPVGSPDNPYHIYDNTRVVERPDVVAPERHPFGAPGAKQAPVQAPEPDDSVRELRRLMGKPEVTDQSSIYRMPTNSPLAALLA
jgi:hypothetical protein